MDTDGLAVLGHELRTPLAGVLGLAAFLLEEQDDLPPSVQEKLGLIHDDADYLLGLLDGLVMEMRGATSAEPESARALDPVRLVDRILASQRAVAQRKGLDLVIDVIGTMPDRLLLPVRTLRQILLNLVANAIRYTEQGEVRIRLEARDRLTVTVADSGRGVASGDLERIFQRYQQAPGEGPRAGLGLGLWLAATLAQRLGGGISIASQPGRGSAFRLDLPLLRPEPGAAEATPSGRLLPILSGELGPDPRRPLLGRRLLVVDDSASSRLLLAAFLKRQGARVQLAANQEQAEAAVGGGGRVDALLIDLHLHGQEGTELLGQLREQGCTVPAIAMSADQRGSELARQADFATFLAKPLDLATLCACLEGILPARA